LCDAENRKYPGIPSNYPVSTLVNSQFNVYENGQYACSPLPYNRRDFYKISLLIGHSRLTYADKGIEIDRPALVFSTDFE